MERGRQVLRLNQARSGVEGVGGKPTEQHLAWHTNSLDEQGAFRSDDV